MGNEEVGKKRTANALPSSSLLRSLLLFLLHLAILIVITILILLTLVPLSLYQQPSPTRSTFPQRAHPD